MKVDAPADRQRMMGAVDTGLVEVAGVQLTPVDAGFRIRETDEYIVEVHRMLFNWRLVVMLPGQDLFLEHGYCYFGLGLESLARAVAAGVTWEDPLNTPPDGFDKQAY